MIIAIVKLHWLKVAILLFGHLIENVVYTQSASVWHLHSYPHRSLICFLNLQPLDKLWEKELCYLAKQEL